jgi:hypothetical protein
VALAQNGLSMEDAQNAPATAVGGENASTVIVGRARHLRAKKEFTAAKYS